MGTRYVALLRAANVGGQGKIAMASLRDAVEGAGHTDVETYIQSGNVVFTARTKTTPAVTEAIERATGARFDVVLRTAGELKAIVAGCPFPGEERGTHVGFLAAKAPAAAIRAAEAVAAAPERLVVRGANAYLLLPNGVGRSKLPPAAARALGVPMTLRNWNTVTALLALAER